jgi:hypothetical protein
LPEGLCPFISLPVKQPMYRLDFLEQLKLRAVASPEASQLASVSPTAWRLGYTSMLTDISSEMVNSMLPAYLVLYLHASPLTFGVIDGLYHGMAVALLGVAGGVMADRSRRYKEVAAAGYGVSALCKLGLLAAGSSMPMIGAIVAVDRAGKGIRTAPRDALLSFSSTTRNLTTTYAVHRALDAGGTLLGPLLAFAILAGLPHAYDAVWVTSFVFALLGLAVLWLFVGNPAESEKTYQVPVESWWSVFQSNEKFGRVLAAASVLALVSISDGFLYLLLQNKTGAAAHFFPLYFVGTSVCYMLLSVPVGMLATRVGRRNVLLGAYAILLCLYCLITSGVAVPGAFPVIPLVLLGLFYAGSEGILMALASSTIPARQRTTGLALLNTSIGLSRMAGLTLFGWLWHSKGPQTALAYFEIGLASAIVAALWLLACFSSGQKNEA